MSGSSVLSNFDSCLQNLFSDVISFEDYLHFINENNLTLYSECLIPIQCFGYIEEHKYKFIDLIFNDSITYQEYKLNILKDILKINQCDPSDSNLKSTNPILKYINESIASSPNINDLGIHLLSYIAVSRFDAIRNEISNREDNDNECVDEEDNNKDNNDEDDEEDNNDNEDADNEDNDEDSDSTSNSDAFEPSGIWYGYSEDDADYNFTKHLWKD